MNRPMMVFVLAGALAGCAGNPQPESAAPASSAQAAVLPEAGVQLSEERVMELGRTYTGLIHAGAYEQLWQATTPEARERFGSFDEFRGTGERVASRLGEELGVITEAVEPARAGMLASKLYLRVSNYAGVPGRAVRLMVGVMDDGSIAGLQVRPVD